VDLSFSAEIDLVPIIRGMAALGLAIGGVSLWRARRRAGATPPLLRSDAVAWTPPVDPSVVQLPPPNTATFDVPLPLRYPAYSVPDAVDREV